jgi:hypothetical protein
LLFRSRTQGSGLGDFGSTQMFRVLGLPCVCTWSSDWLIHFVDTGDSFSHKMLFVQASPTLAAAYSISKAVRIPVMCASGISAVTAPMACAAGAAGVGVGSAVNKLNDQLAMVAAVRSIADALSLRSGSHASSVSAVAH